MIRLIEVKAPSIDNNFSLAFFHNGSSAVDISVFGVSESIGLAGPRFRFEYEDLGDILTYLIDKDKDFVEGIELAREQLRKGEVVTYEEVFGD